MEPGKLNDLLGMLQKTIEMDAEIIAMQRETIEKLKGIVDDVRKVGAAVYSAEEEGKPEDQSDNHTSPD
jgi:hypothetical protein